MKSFSEYLVELVRMTRGQASRAVKFLGLVTEVQSKNADGSPAFTKPRQKKDGTTPAPEPIMEDVNPDTLPDSGSIYSAISEALGNVEGKLRLTLARTYNAIVFSQEVLKTQEVIIDSLTPVFVEYGITDPDEIATLRRIVTATYNNRVERGKIKADQTPEEKAETKAKLLRINLD